MSRMVVKLPGRAAARAAPDAAGRPPIRLMLVDDSHIARAVLTRMISAHPGFEIVATAGNAAEALDALRAVEVDIVLLDVEMPGTSGLDALPDILRLGRGARVLVVSSTTEDGAEATVRALALGAVDTLPKPGAGNFAGRFSEVLVGKLRAIGHARRDEDAPQMQGAAETVDISRLKVRAMPEHKLGCLALGASTGGLHALSEFLRALPQQIGAPILITQHLPPVFIPFFARQIEAASGRLSAVAEEGALLQEERILIAPGDAHVELERSGGKVGVKLSRRAVSSGCMPSVDPMFTSVAEAYGQTGLGVVLSGMGRDGLEGSRELIGAGGAVLVQNEGTSAVWGMPRAVAEAGLASAILAPSDLAKRVGARVTEGQS